MTNKLNFILIFCLGEFLETTIVYNIKPIRIFEEKKVEVHIAIKMIRDLVLHKFYIFIFISADRNPTLQTEFIKEYKPRFKIL